MAFISFAEQSISLTGDLDKILQGTTYVRVYTIKNAAGAAIDMSEWIGTAPKCEFKNLESGGVTTNCPQPTLTWLAQSGPTLGQIQMVITKGASTAATVYSGFYQIEITHPGGTGGIEANAVSRPFRGDWTIDRETVLI